MGLLFESSSIGFSGGWPAALRLMSGAVLTNPRRKQYELPSNAGQAPHTALRRLPEERLPTSFRMSWELHAGLWLSIVEPTKTGRMCTFFIQLPRTMFDHGDRMRDSNHEVEEVIIIMFRRNPPCIAGSPAVEK